MKKTFNLLLIYLFVFIILVGCKNEDFDFLSSEDINGSKTAEENISLYSEFDNSSDANNKKKNLLQSLYGKWLYSEDNSWFMEINEETIVTAIENSGCINTNTYELTEINIDMNYVILNIKKVNIPSEGEGDDEIKETNYFDKINIDENQLRYIYKYNNEAERYESLWTKN